MNINDFKIKKGKRQKVSVITCYDYSFAKIIDNTDVDCVLVGDSGSMIMHGFPSTVHATTDMIAIMIQAVSRGIKDKFIIGDMPFLSNRSGLKTAMKTVDSFMKAGAHAVKLEGVDGNEKIIEHIVESGVPVMGHIGLTPQSVNAFGGYSVQGKNIEKAEKLINEAKKLESLGCFGMVLECIPSELAKTITDSVSISTICIGAGPDTDGQVLVLQDMLGMNNEIKPKFVRHYLNGNELIQKAVNSFHSDVLTQQYPLKEESYK